MKTGVDLEGVVMLDIAIVEDEKAAAKSLLHYIEKYYQTVEKIS